MTTGVNNVALGDTEIVVTFGCGEQTLPFEECREKITPHAERFRNDIEANYGIALGKPEVLAYTSSEQIRTIEVAFRISSISYLEAMRVFQAAMTCMTNAVTSEKIRVGAVFGSIRLLPGVPVLLL